MAAGGSSFVANRTHALQKLEEVTVRGKHESRIFRDDGLVRLHGSCEFVERYRLGALVVSSGVDFGGFRVCQLYQLFRYAYLSLNREKQFLIFY